jgi:uncharacterized protein involved in type VI secretion and phage assembly
MRILIITLMQPIELRVGSADEALSVRRVAVREAASECFRVVAHVVSSNDDIDLETMVGAPAELRIATGAKHLSRNGRLYSGVCTKAQQA